MIATTTRYESTVRITSSRRARRALASHRWARVRWLEANSKNRAAGRDRIDHEGPVSEDTTRRYEIAYLNGCFWHVYEQRSTYGAARAAARRLAHRGFEARVFDQRRREARYLTTNPTLAVAERVHRAAFRREGEAVRRYGFSSPQHRAASQHTLRAWRCYDRLVYEADRS